MQELASDGDWRSSQHPIIQYGVGQLERAQRYFSEQKDKRALSSLWTAEANLRSSSGGLQAVSDLARQIAVRANDKTKQEAQLIVEQVERDLRDLAAAPPEVPSRWRVGMPVTTTSYVPGREIVEYVGEVFGVIVRSRGALPVFGAQLKSFVGGELGTMSNLLDRSRRDAVDRMVAEAQERGADAVVSMRLSADSIGEGWTEICAYGTAVKSRPVAPEADPGSSAS